MMQIAICALVLNSRLFFFFRPPRIPQITHPSNVGWLAVAPPKTASHAPTDRRPTSWVECNEGGNRIQFYLPGQSAARMTRWRRWWPMVVKGRSARDLQSYSMQLQRSVVVGVDSLMAVQHAMKFLHYVLYVYCVFLIKCPRWYSPRVALAPLSLCAWIVNNYLCGLEGKWKLGID